jgi:hypothetical protein
VLKNVFLGAIGGGALAAVLATVAIAVLMASDSHSGEYAAVAGALAAPLGAGLGALAGGLAAKRSVTGVALLCGGLGLGFGAFIFFALVTMAKDNWVMGLLAMVVGGVGGLLVGGGVARWRRPR